MNITQKKENVERIHARLSETSISILVDYKGLDVEAMTQLRNQLRAENVELEVIKNTLMKRASEGTDAALITDAMVGPSALATCSDDPIAPARLLVKFAEDNDKLEIKAGAMSGKALTPDDIKALAKLPSKEALLGQLLSVLNGVPTSFVRVLSGVPSGLLTVLTAVGEQKEAA